MPAKGILRIKILGDAKGVDSAVGVAVDKVKAGALAIGAAFVAGIGKAMDVEAATDKMSAALGLTAKESERLGGVAGKLYANAYGESMVEVTDAVESVVSSIGGMRTASAAAVEDVTAKVLNLAKAFELEAGRAAQIAGQLVSSGFAKDSTQALDLLTAGLQRVPKAVREDLIDALDEYTPFMHTVGLEGQRGMQLLVNAAQKGMYGIDKTGDALKEFTVLATDMSTASKVGFDAIGMSQEDMTAKILAGGRSARIAFDQIVKGLLGIKDPVKQSQAALALFGTPLEDLSTSDIPKFLSGLLDVQGGLGKVDGAADRLGTTLNDNAKTNLTAFWRQLQAGAVNIIGGKVIPAITGLVSWLREHLGPALQTAGRIVQEVVIKPLQALLGWINRNKDAVGFFVTVIGGAVAPFLAYKGAIVLITGAMKIWRAVTRGVAIAQALLNIVMRANPIGIVITAVAGLVAGIIYLWNKSAKFRDFFKDVWRKIKSAIQPVIDAVQFVIGLIQDAIRFTKGLISDILGIPSGKLGGGKKFGGGRALGGEISPTKFYVVGERGPELFFPGQSGRMLSHVDSEALMASADRDARASLAAVTSGVTAAPSSGSAGTVVYNFSFPNYLGSKEDLKRELREAVRRKGRGSAQQFFGANA